MAGPGRNLSNKGGVLFGLSLLLVGVTRAGAEPFWVYLVDKGPNRSAALTDATSTALARRLVSPMASLATEADIPLNPRYLRMIELSGARIRARSRWLNAVSVEADSALAARLQTESFVSAVEPVAVEREELPLIQRREAIDSSFFGNTYRQLQLLNIPQVHDLGVFGEGVRIGFLDTGLKRDHPVFKTLKLGGEHDFITGDNIILWDAVSGEYKPLVSDYEIVWQPELHGSWIFFIADYTPFNEPTSRVFYARSNDTTITLSETDLMSSAGIARSYAVSGTDDLIVVWEEGGVNNKMFEDPYSRNLRWGILSLSGFKKNSELLDTYSRNPFMLTDGDTSLVFYVKDNSTVRLIKGVREAGSVSWGASLEVFAPGGILDRPKAVLLGDTILVAALDLEEGKLHLARSVDTASFTTIPFPTDAEVLAFDLDGNHLLTAQIDPGSGGARLHSFQTTDQGSSWKEYVHPDTFAVIDRVDLVNLGGGGVHVVFESAGEVFITSSPGAFDSWSEPTLLSAEFSYQPYLNPALQVVWVERGDDNTDFDPLEDGFDISGFSQPAHGSRVTALAAGYEGMTYIGAAPGAEVYVAKTEKHINRYGASYELRVEEDMWIEGLEWLERQGVDIVNSSLGYGDWYTYEERDGKTSPASRAATMARERGVLVVNAAGNVRSSSPYILPPSDAEGTLTVGGVDTLGNWWEQSSGAEGSAVGPTSDGRLKPELVAPAKGIYVIDVDDTIGPSYFYGQGTSYAAPLVAGCAALMLEAHPEYRGNPDTIIRLLEESASLAGNPNDTLGYGIPDAYKALLPLPPGIDTFVRNELLPPYPNPFYPSSQSRVYFPFRFNKGSTRVFIRVYTLSGELVVEAEIKPPTPNKANSIGVGRYDKPSDLEKMGAYWDGLLPQSGKPAASGLYMVVLHTEYGTHATRFILLR